MQSTQDEKQPQIDEKRAQEAPNNPSVSRTVINAIASSFIVIGFILFLTLDTLLRFIPPEKLGFSPYETTSRTAIYYGVCDFHKHKKKPDIVLMGSSLMMTALNGGDAAYLNRPINPALHHSSTCFEAKLKEQFDQTFSTFAFSVDGEMVSDAFVIAETLLRGPQKPEVIIYGIAPRDFMDHALPSPAATTIFKYLKRIADLSHLDKEAYISTNEKIEHFFEKLSFIYQHRPDFIYRQNALGMKLIGKLMPNYDFRTVQCPIHIRKQAFVELPEDTGLNEAIVEPPSAIEPFHDNSDEYRYRYKKINKKQMDSQFAFLQRLLYFCKENKIKMILVNMPLTQTNLDLMQPGYYEQYKNRVHTIAETGGAEVLDLNDTNTFPKKYFGDTVHLNSRGDVHFYSELAKALKAKPETNLVLTGIGKNNL